jgi:hypothetical protein
MVINTNGLLSDSKLSSAVRDVIIQRSGPSEGFRKGNTLKRELQCTIFRQYEDKGKVIPVIFFLIKHHAMKAF